MPANFSSVCHYVSSLVESSIEVEHKISEEEGCDDAGENFKAVAEIDVLERQKNGDENQLPDNEEHREDIKGNPEKAIWH